MVNVGSGFDVPVGVGVEVTEGVQLGRKVQDGRGVRVGVPVTVAVRLGRGVSVAKIGGCVAEGSTEGLSLDANRNPAAIIIARNNITIAIRLEGFL
jgi:hypothetical protein